MQIYTQCSTKIKALLVEYVKDDNISDSDFIESVILSTQNILNELSQINSCIVYLVLNADDIEFDQVNSVLTNLQGDNINIMWGIFNPIESSRISILTQ